MSTNGRLSFDSTKMVAQAKLRVKHSGKLATANSVHTVTLCSGNIDYQFGYVFTQFVSDNDIAIFKREFNAQLTIALHQSYPDAFFNLTDEGLYYSGTNGDPSRAFKECIIYAFAITSQETNLYPNLDEGSIHLIPYGEVCQSYDDPLPVPTDPGGGGGGGSNANMDLFNSKIDQTGLTPCFKQVLASLQGIDKYCIPNMVAIFADTIPGYNWTLSVGALNQSSNGETSSAFNRTTETVTTIFNQSNFRSGTDLAVAKTILHESLHAYLVAYFSLDQTAAINTYSQYADEVTRIKNPGMNDAQHDQIVRGFIGSVALLLKEYGRNQGYVATDQYYEDLAWGGLTDTRAFKNLSQAVQDRIIDVILTEQTGVNSQGNPVTQIGRKSGC